MSPHRRASTRLSYSIFSYKYSRCAAHTSQFWKRTNKVNMTEPYSIESKDISPTSSNTHANALSLGMTNPLSTMPEDCHSFDIQVRGKALFHEQYSLTKLHSRICCRVQIYQCVQIYQQRPVNTPFHNNLSFKKVWSWLLAMKHWPVLNFWMAAFQTGLHIEKNFFNRLYLPMYRRGTCIRFQKYAYYVFKVPRWATVLCLTKC